MKKYVILYLLVFLSILACQTIPPVTDSDRIKIFSYSNDEVFEAIKSAFFDLNIEIIEGSKDGGFLVGKRNIGGETIFAIMTGEQHTLYGIYRINLSQESNESTCIKARLVSALEDGSNEDEYNKYRYDEFWEIVLKHLSQ